jgi:light-regulated signal transduction histidine kinase (bacteriophytochrome)
MKCADELLTPFERLRAASDLAGTDIGLATVHRIVRRHGGRTWAEAAVDEGATFHFSLSASNR